MKWEIPFVLCFGAVIAYHHVPTAPLVETPLGTVRGSFMETRLGKKIYAFRGIRFAKPPINELRFQPPVPVEKWDGIYNATEDGAWCPQFVDVPDNEDCLFLNVYSTELPVENKNPKRSVLVFFHPGGFYVDSGASSLFGPQYLLDEDIVLVTTNYRLGSLGFLSTGTKEAPGNNGLKDQVMVLRWVRDNIAAFGGNPDSVTISGNSAGSRSVAVHILSPLSRGLFHRVIGMSGTAYGQQILGTNQLHLAKRQAQLLNCPDDTPKRIIDCLKTKPAKDIANSFNGFKEFYLDPVLIWTPVIEPDFGQPRFLTEHPITQVLKGDFDNVPIMSGVTTEEFGRRAIIYARNSTILREFDEDYERVWPIVFSYERGTENSKRISRGLRNFYVGSDKIDNSSLEGISHMYADGLVGFPVNRGVKLLSRQNDVYYYLFSYLGRYSYSNLPIKSGKKPFGVVHQDDLMYVFYMSRLFPKFTEQYPESEHVAKMTKIWGNFIKTGKPIPVPSKELDNVEWERYESEHQKYMDLGKTLIMKERLFEDRYSTWEKLFPLSNYQ